MFGFHLTFDGSGNPSLTQPLTTALSTLPGGTSPVIANGELYYVTNNSPYVLYAVSASTGAVIWQSTASINNIHWQSPIVVNGRLFLVDGNATLWVHILDGIFKDGFQ
jgi:outer membrane protein assembly factor BamB